MCPHSFQVRNCYGDLHGEICTDQGSKQLWGFYPSDYHHSRCGGWQGARLGHHPTGELTVQVSQDKKTCLLALRLKNKEKNVIPLHSFLQFITYGSYFSAIAVIFFLRGVYTIMRVRQSHRDSTTAEEPPSLKDSDTCPEQRLSRRN